MFKQKMGKWYFKIRIQEFYQALEAGVLLSALEKTRGTPGGKRRIKEVMQRGGDAASNFQYLALQAGSFSWLNDGDVDLCFELDMENRNGELRLPRVPLESLVAVGVTKKHFESVEHDLKDNYRYRRYEKVKVEQRRSF